MNNLNDLLTVRDAALALGVSEIQVQKWALAGRLAGRKIGHNWVFLPDTVRNFRRALRFRPVRAWPRDEAREQLPAERYARLEEMCRLLSAGAKRAQVADRIGVSRQTIHAELKRYAHIEEFRPDAETISEKISPER